LKKDVVTIAGKPSLDIPPAFEEHPQTGWGRVVTETPLEYLVIYERCGKSYGAYVPDLPGCVAVGETKEEAARLIREAIFLHVTGMAKEGLPVPEPSSSTEYVKIY
jgi:predicted RNase H-like HicB family nuclease